MSIPYSLMPIYNKLDDESKYSVNRAYNQRRKSFIVGYLAWVVFGLHYFYTGKVFLQFVFWFTLGGLGVWYFIDFFRMPWILGEKNEDIARALLVQYKNLSQ
jgi:TM2 domain-containing membrane protein YozV